MKRDWWKDFFTPSTYDLRWTTHPVATRLEAREVRDLLRLPRGARVLDLACGIGRHSLLLAEAGYRVTGVDYSRPYLALARKAAGRLGAPARTRLSFLRADMRRLPFRGEFDAVVNLFTSFGYFLSPAEDRAVLKGMFRALKPGGRVLLDYLNGEKVLRAFKPKDWVPCGEGYMLIENRLREGKDPAVLSRWRWVRPGEPGRWARTFVRLYTRDALKREVARAGFREARALAGLLEAGTPPLERRRMLVVARKPEGQER